jgi:hypothetical protein
VVPRSSDSQHRLTTGISFDVIDLDAEAVIAALEEARADRERLQGPVVKTGNAYHYLVLQPGLAVEQEDQRQRARRRNIPSADWLPTPLPLVTGKRNKINVATQQSGVEMATPAPE